MSNIVRELQRVKGSRVRLMQVMGRISDVLRCTGYGAILLDRELDADDRKDVNDLCKKLAARRTRYLRTWPLRMKAKARG